MEKLDHCREKLKRSDIERVKEKREFFQQKRKLKNSPKNCEAVKVQLLRSKKYTRTVVKKVAHV